jgi:hypothetical protein
MQGANRGLFSKLTVVVKNKINTIHGELLGTLPLEGE